MNIHSSKSKFVLMSTEDYNQTKLNSMPSGYLAAIENSDLSFPIMASSVAFNSIQLLGNSTYQLIYLDDESMEGEKGVVMFYFLNLEQGRTLAFINNEFQVYGTIMKSPHPLNLTVSNTLFIDYYNMDGGFIFESN